MGDGLPRLSFRLSADRDSNTPSCVGSEPDRLKLFSSSTATDCTNPVEQPLDKIRGVVGQQLTPYLQGRVSW